MRHGRPASLIAVIFFILLGFPFAANCLLLAPPQQSEPRNTQVTRTIGTIKNIQADSITLSPDSGGEISAIISKSTKFLRVAPGQTDLKNATAVQPEDLQPGDRVLVRGQGSPDGRSITALAVIVMKQADLSAKQEREQQEWQRRGVGGLVSSADNAAGTVSITSGGFGSTHEVLIRTSKSTVVRRYAPDSVKFDDAKPAPLDQIKPGDQLRARGTRSPDGGELSADEIVFGTFRNIAGTISSVDQESNSATVQDLIGKGEVTVAISPDSQVKKLPPEMAQRIAMRLKAAGTGETGPSGNGQGSKVLVGAAASDRASQSSAGPGTGEHGNGAPDLQRFLSRLPNSALSDLHKGDAVMIVSTVGEGSGPVKAIVLLAGVEPILTANGGRSNSMLLSPWTLSGPAGEGEGTP